MKEKNIYETERHKYLHKIHMYIKSCLGKLIYGCRVKEGNRNKVGRNMKICQTSDAH